MRRAALICGTGVCLLSGLACTGTHGNPAPILGRVPHSVSGTSASPAAKAVREPDGAWGIPNFFELGSAVRTEQSEVAVDTTAWLQALSNRDERTPAAYLNALHAPRNKVLIYPEQDGLGRTRRFALVLPEQRTFSQNDAVRAYWGRSAEFLSFAVGAAHSAGTVLMGPGEAARAVTLRSLLEPSGVNAQEFENSYQLEGTSRDVHEHKGLVPGLPVAFAEFAFVERASHVREPGKELLPTTDPSGPVAQAGVSPALILTFAPLNHGVWRELSSASVGRHRVLVMSNDEGEVYFVAAPLALAPSWHFGAMGRDLVAQAGPLPDPVRARDQPAAILLLPRATRARLFSGKVKSSAEIGGLLDQAEHFVDGAARARDQLDPGASSTVIRHYARALLETHRSRLDARLLTRFQYGDVEQPINASGGAGAIRFTSDQAAALRALAHSYRRTRDPELLTSLRGLALASLAAIGPGGTIVDRRFDQMALLGNSDPKTARADAQIDNGGVAVTFNHRNLIFARGQDHLPGFTWGSLRLDSAANMLLDGETDEFAIDANSIPRTVDPAQSSLEISRWFSSKHVRARETARVIRGLPAARISYMLEPRTRHGSEPLSANVTLGDFLDYGSGNNEAFQNRFGLSRVIGGAPLPVAFWMEGAEAPLWGDNSPSGLVDVTNEMKRLHPRFVAVYAYDRAALFYFTKLPDQLFLRNVQGGMAGSYHGFTSLTARYEIPAANDGQRTELSPVYGYTLWAPLYSEDDDGVPDQLQQLGKVWANTIEDHERGAGAVQGHSSLPEGDCCANPLKNAFYLSLQSDTGYADLQYAWALVSDLLAEAAREPENVADQPALHSTAEQLREHALRGAELSLRALSQLQNRPDLQPAFANMKSYGFHVALFDWAYRNSCDPRFLDAVFALADEIASPAGRGGLQITSADQPNHGAYLLSRAAREQGASRLDDQGIKLWALRIAYERRRKPEYVRSAALFMDAWLQQRAEDRLFSGMVRQFDRYLPAGLGEERSPAGHYAILVGLKAWADRLPRARQLYERGFEYTSARADVRRVGYLGPYRMLSRSDGLADFGGEAELGAMLLWAMTGDTHGKSGSKTCTRSVRAPALTDDTRVGAH